MTLLCTCYACAHSTAGSAGSITCRNLERILANRAIEDSWREYKYNRRNAAYSPPRRREPVPELNMSLWLAVPITIAYLVFGTLLFIYILFQIFLFVLFVLGAINPYNR